MALVLDRRTRRLFPFIERIYGDGGYQGPKAARAATKTGYWTIEIVNRSPAAVGFEVLVAGRRSARSGHHYIPTWQGTSPATLRDTSIRIGHSHRRWLCLEQLPCAGTVIMRDTGTVIMRARRLNALVAVAIRQRSKTREPHRRSLCLELKRRRDRGCRC